MQGAVVWGKKPVYVRISFTRGARKIHFPINGRIQAGAGQETISGGGLRAAFQRTRNRLIRQQAYNLNNQ
jgi:hypothetical protein